MSQGSQSIPYSSGLPVFRIEFGTPAHIQRQDRLLRLVFWGIVLCVFSFWWFRVLESWVVIVVAVLTARIITQYVRHLPPTWDATVDRYRDHINGIGSVWKKAIAGTSYGSTGVVAFMVAARMLAVAAYLGMLPHSRELIAIALRARVSVGDLLVMQYVYEACACCTAVVYECSGHCVHLRTLDWEMPFDLRPVTFVIEGHLHGRHVFTAASWPAYVGVLTALKMRPQSRDGSSLGQTVAPSGAFSVSTNFRIGGQAYKHNFAMFLLGGYTIGNLLRTCVLNDDSYQAAVERVCSEWLIAPAYITVVSGTAVQAIQVTRSRLRHLHPVELKDDGTIDDDDDSNDVWDHSGDQVRIVRRNIRSAVPWIIQANIDHWHKFPDFMHSLPRQALASKHLRTLRTDLLAEARSRGWALLSQPPIYNSKSIYGAVIIPAVGEFDCRIGQPLPQLGVGENHKVGVALHKLTL